MAGVAPSVDVRLPDVADVTNVANVAKVVDVPPEDGVVRYLQQRMLTSLVLCSLCFLAPGEHTTDKIVYSCFSTLLHARLHSNI